MSTAEERTRGPRLTATLTVVLSNGEAPYVMEIENVSDTGVRLRSNEAFTIGTRMHMVFGRPPDLPRITAEGIVRWCDSEKGVGVEFTSINSYDHQALLKFMESQSGCEQT
jgi:hypothetical protein